MNLVPNAIIRFQGCGYGCQLHHVVYCFIVAYATQRTLILKSKGWRYARGGWEEVFEPVSKTCTSLEGASISSWPGNIWQLFVFLSMDITLVPGKKICIQNRVGHIYKGHLMVLLC